MPELREQIVQIIRRRFSNMPSVSTWRGWEKATYSMADAILKLIEPRGESELREVLSIIVERADQYTRDEVMPDDYEQVMSRARQALARPSAPPDYKRLMKEALFARQKQGPDEGGQPDYYGGVSISDTHSAYMVYMELPKGSNPMRSALASRDEWRPKSKAVARWSVRGVGYGGNAPDLVTGEFLERGPDLSGFVSSKAIGEFVVEIFGGRARLDYRASEPNWIQVKVCCEDEDVLRNLERLVRENEMQITPEIVAQCKLPTPPTSQERKS